MPDQRTILVVDDDRELREGLKTVLGRNGYRTLEADDGQEARQLIDEHRPDLVILDMMMPRWGGLAVLEHFRGKSGAPRFIMITGTEGEKHKNYAEWLGVIDYIQKPFSMDRLLERVAKAVPVSVQRTAQTAEIPAGFIRCRCPSCGARIKAPLQMVGQTRKCPGCSRSFLVVIPPPEDQGPMLVM